MTIAALLFDCDGVLIDSEGLAAHVTSAALAEIGIRFAEEDLIARFAGISDREMYATIEEESGKAFPPGYSDLVEEQIAQAFQAGLRAVTGVHAALAELPYLRCVASGSTPIRLATALQCVGLYDAFVPHIYSASFVSRGKPAPDLFLYAARQLGVEPQQCVVIEDSVAGVTAGRDAGMRVIGFTGASHCGLEHGTRLEAAGADCVIRDFGELTCTISQLARSARWHGCA